MLLVLHDLELVLHCSLYLINFFNLVKAVYSNQLLGAAHQIHVVYRWLCILISSYTLIYYHNIYIYVTPLPVFPV